MKALLLLAALFTVHAHAALDVCKLEDTVAFDEAVEAKKAVLISESDNHKRWTAVEKKMIHATIKSDGYSEKLNQYEALRQFGDYYEDDKEPGSNAGEIEYYKIGKVSLALVHYWPGDNEVGAFIELLPNGKFKLVATISDQWISCER